MMKLKIAKLLQENSYLDVIDEENWELAVQQLLENGVAVAAKYQGLKEEIVKLQSEIRGLKAINKLLESDAEDYKRLLECKVEDVYADFMADYKIMRDELDGLYDDYHELSEKYRLAVAEREANVKGFAEQINTMRADAIKLLLENAKDDAEYLYNGYDDCMLAIRIDDLERIAKYMTGAKNDKG